MIVIIATAIQILINTVASLVGVLTMLLPASPFQNLALTLGDSQLLRWLAWILPLNFVLITISSWLVAMAHFYALSVILRKINVIK